MQQPTNAGKVLAFIQPRDPLVLRDARPFTTAPGSRAFSLPWPHPRTAAGTIRTHVGEKAGLDWSRREDARAARQIIHHGPLMAAQNGAHGEWVVHVPAPRDVVFYRPDGAPKDLAHITLRPQYLETGEGCDLPEQISTPNTGYEKALANTRLRPLSITDDVKPEGSVPQWWTLDDAVNWLNSLDSKASQVLPFSAARNEDGQRVLRGLGDPESDVRMHVSIDPDTGVNLNGALFATEGRAFRDLPVANAPAVAMLSKVSTELSHDLAEDSIHLGGERRLSFINFKQPSVSWPKSSDSYPSEEDITSATGLRIQMVTPALFRHGWLPAWMADATIPGMGGMKVGLRLVGAAVGRQLAVSGWGLAPRESAEGGDGIPRPGPRATQYAVPAGSVYFFEFIDGKPEAEKFREIWDALWLTPVSDREIDRNEGFGLVLPGLWNDESENGEHS